MSGRTNDEERHYSGITRHWLSVLDLQGSDPRWTLLLRPADATGQVMELVAVAVFHWPQSRSLLALDGLLEASAEMGIPMTTPSVEQIRQAIDRLQTEVALSRDIDMNQNEQFADDIALVCASLTEAQGELQKEHEELLTRVDSLRLSDATGSTASTDMGFQRHSIERLQLSDRLTTLAQRVGEYPMERWANDALAWMTDASALLALRTGSVCRMAHAADCDGECVEKSR